MHRSHDVEDTFCVNFTPRSSIKRVFAMVYVDDRQVINRLVLAIKSSTIVIYSASMKSYQYLNYNFLENNTAQWLLIRSLFWSTTDWFKEIKQFHEPWNYCARDARAFYVFRSI